MSFRDNTSNLPFDSLVVVALCGLVLFVCFIIIFCLRLQDLFQQEKGRKRPSVPPSPGRLRQGEESKVWLTGYKPLKRLFYFFPGAAQ